MRINNTLILNVDTTINEEKRERREDVETTQYLKTFITNCVKELKKTGHTLAFKKAQIELIKLELPSIEATKVDYYYIIDLIKCNCGKELKTEDEIKHKMCAECLRVAGFRGGDEEYNE